MKIIKKIENNTTYKIIGIIVVISSFIVIIRSYDKSEPQKIEQFSVSSINQQGGITAGKVEIKNSEENIKIPSEQNVYYKIYTYKDKTIIEVRPKQGVWYPFLVGIPIAEKDNVALDLFFGPAGKLPTISYTDHIYTKSDDGKWWVIISENQATINQSFYLTYKNEPSTILFGPKKEDNNYYGFSPSTIKH